jgi:hypothetical protein
MRDLRRQTKLDAGQAVIVLALGADGVPAHVDLRPAMKWSTRGWELQLACPTCGEPSRVLRQRDEVYCCARCAPRSTPHHRRKNCRSWRDGGRTTSEIVHELIRSDGPPRARLYALAAELVRGAMARAEALLPHICTSLDAADELVCNRECEERR